MQHPELKSQTQGNYGCRSRQRYEDGQQRKGPPLVLERKKMKSNKELLGDGAVG